MNLLVCGRHSPVTKSQLLCVSCFIGVFLCHKLYSPYSLQSPWLFIQSSLPIDNGFWPSDLIFFMLVTKVKVSHAQDSGFGQSYSDIFTYWKIGLFPPILVTYFVWAIKCDTVYLYTWIAANSCRLLISARDIKCQFALSQFVYRLSKHFYGRKSQFSTQVDSYQSPRQIVALRVTALRQDLFWKIASITRKVYLMKVNNLMNQERSLFWLGYQRWTGNHVVLSPTRLSLNQS